MLRVSQSCGQPVTPLYRFFWSVAGELSAKFPEIIKNTLQRSRIALDASGFLGNGKVRLEGFAGFLGHSGAFGSILEGVCKAKKPLKCP